MSRPASQFMDAEVKAEYDKFKESVNAKTLDLLQREIPKRILELNRRFDMTKNHINLEDLEKWSELELKEQSKKCYANSDTGVAVTHSLHDNLMPAHQQISVVLQQLQSELAEQAEIIQCIKLWILLHVPRIEDGDNFGVAVQEETITELTRVEECCANFFASVSMYRSCRSKLLSKIMKYPNVQDYVSAVSELDQREWLKLKIFQIDMRNDYTIVLELLRKNWDRIVKPRNTDSTSMIV